MQMIELPEHYNYIGAFLTYDCNLGCDYCLNQSGEFEATYELTADQWIEGLSRLQTKQDLPITIQGGEPTLYKGFYKLVDDLYHKGIYMDLLTNGKFSRHLFCKNISPDVFMRRTKYASMRFSFHQKTGLMELLRLVWDMKADGYEVGIWAVNFPGSKTQSHINTMKRMCAWPSVDIDFRVKEYLGTYKGVWYGTYKYPDACKGIGGKEVMCRPSELLIGPDGYVYRCHADLYAHRLPIGHILGEIQFPEYLKCKHYGSCNPCDVKLKTNRFQESGHCSVDIKFKEERDG